MIVGGGCCGEASSAVLRTRALRAGTLRTRAHRAATLRRLRELVVTATVVVNEVLERHGCLLIGCWSQAG